MFCYERGSTFWLIFFGPTGLLNNRWNTIVTVFWNISRDMPILGVGIFRRLHFQLFFCFGFRVRYGIPQTRGPQKEYAHPPSRHVSVRPTQPSTFIAICIICHGYCCSCKYVVVGEVNGTVILDIIPLSISPPVLFVVDSYCNITSTHGDRYL